MSVVQRLSIQIVEELANGRRRSLRAGGNDSRAIVVNLVSEQGMVACMALQYDDSGRPVMRLKREQGFECRIESFGQTKLFEFKEGKEYVG